MSDYEELVHGVAKAIRRNQIERTTIGRAYDPDVEPSLSEIANARAAIAEVRRTLETVTPEMVKAWDDVFDEKDFPTSEDYATGDWLAMLRASPLTPPKDAP